MGQVKTDLLRKGLRRCLANVVDCHAEETSAVVHEVVVVLDIRRLRRVVAHEAARKITIECDAA